MEVSPRDEARDGSAMVSRVLVVGRGCVRACVRRQRVIVFISNGGGDISAFLCIVCRYAMHDVFMPDSRTVFVLSKRVTSAPPEGEKS